LKGILGNLETAQKKFDSLAANDNLIKAADNVFLNNLNKLSGDSTALLAKTGVPLNYYPLLKTTIDQAIKDGTSSAIFNSYSQQIGNAISMTKEL